MANESYVAGNRPGWAGARCLAGEFEWFAERINQYDLRPMRMACNSCPLQRRCLETAVEMISEPGFILAGIWGGLTSAEIRKFSGGGNVDVLMALSRHKAVTSLKSKRPGKSAQTGKMT
jgi:hypothetical protein